MKHIKVEISLNVISPKFQDVYTEMMLIILEYIPENDEMKPQVTGMWTKPNIDVSKTLSLKVLQLNNEIHEKTF